MKPEASPTVKTITWRLAIAIVVITMFIFGCKKEDTVQPSNSSTNTSTSPAPIVITTKTVKFKLSYNGINVEYNHSSSGDLIQLNPYSTPEIFEYTLDENEFISLNATMFFLYPVGCSTCEPFMSISVYVDGVYDTHVNGFTQVNYTYTNDSN